MTFTCWESIYTQFKNPSVIEFSSIHRTNSEVLKISRLSTANKPRTTAEEFDRTMKASRKKCWTHKQLQRSERTESNRNCNMLRYLRILSYKKEQQTNITPSSGAILGFSPRAVECSCRPVGALWRPDQRKPIELSKNKIKKKRNARVPLMSFVVRIVAEFIFFAVVCQISQLRSVTGFWRVASYAS